MSDISKIEEKPEEPVYVEPNLSPKTLGELMDTVVALTQSKPFDEDGYSASANALWQAALAAFNYIAEVEGVTGFQAGYAALHAYGKMMGVEGPYAIIRAEELLYPQYDNKIPELITKWQEGWCAEEAQRKIDEHSKENFIYVHPDVKARWFELAGADETPREEEKVEVENS